MKASGLYQVTKRLLTTNVTDRQNTASSGST